MTNEETYLRERLGEKRNSFRVPEGYFEQLTQRVMQQIPNEQQIADEQQLVTVRGSRQTAAPLRRPSRMVALRPWLYAAACLVAVVVMSLTALFHEETPTATLEAQTESSAYLDEAVDYAMIDNVEIYACLSE